MVDGEGDKVSRCGDEMCLFSRLETPGLIHTLVIKAWIWWHCGQNLNLAPLLLLQKQILMLMTKMMMVLLLPNADSVVVVDVVVDDGDDDDDTWMSVRLNLSSSKSGLVSRNS